MFRIRIHFNADPDPGPHQAPLDSNSDPDPRGKKLNKKNLAVLRIRIRMDPTKNEIADK